MTCEHEVVIPTRRILSDGSIIVFQQCQRCGNGRSVKKSEHKINELPEYDPGVRERYFAACREESERESAQKTFERLTKTGEWWNNYTAYLKSLSWQTTRRVVIDRDRVCQRCFVNACTQAHHLTYETYNKHGFTFPQECVGLCYECHESLHPGCNE